MAVKMGDGTVQSDMRFELDGTVEEGEESARHYNR